jgi:hypothetical protein
LKPIYTSQSGNGSEAEQIRYEIEKIPGFVQKMTEKPVKVDPNEQKPEMSGMIGNKLKS